MRTSHVIDSLTLKIEVNGCKYELTLTAPADVNVDSRWQPAEEAYPAQAIVERVTAAQDMRFESDGVVWVYLAGDDLTRALPKSKIEQLGEQIEATQAEAA